MIKWTALYPVARAAFSLAIAVHSYGMLAPDQITYDYLKGRPMAPSGKMWDEAVAAWRQLPRYEGGGGSLGMGALLHQVNGFIA